MDAAGQPRRLLGLLLIEMGLISEEQLTQALNAQERTGELLGEILIERGYVTRLAIQDALAMQCGVLLKPDPGFGGGLRRELVRRESRATPSVAQRTPESRGIRAGQAGVHEASVTGLSREELVGESEKELERQLKEQLRRLSADVGRHEQRLTELERELETTRHALAKAVRGIPPRNAPVIGLASPEPRFAEDPSEPFVATVGRAREHITARRAALSSPATALP